MNNQKSQSQEDASNAELFLGNLLQNEKQSFVPTGVDITTQIQSEKIMQSQPQQKDALSVIKLLKNYHDAGGLDSVLQNVAQETGEKSTSKEYKLYSVWIKGKLIIVGYYNCFEDARIAINKLRNKHNPRKVKTRLNLNIGQIESILFGDNDLCIYCGLCSNKITIDHVIPVSSLINKKRKGSYNHRGLRVFSCRLCNCKKLHAKFFYSFLERFEYAKNEKWTFSIEFKSIVITMNKRLKTANAFTQNFFQSFINKYLNDTTRRTN